MCENEVEVYKSQGKGERRLNSTIRLGDRMDAETSAVQADSFRYPPHKPLPKKPKRQITKEWRCSFDKEYTG